MPRMLRVELKTPEERNSFFLTIEVFGSGVISAAQAFFSPFALRLGATNTDIGLLTSIPALIKIILSLPLARFLRFRSNQRLWVIGALALNRLGLVLLVLVPFLTGLPFPQGTLVVWLLIFLNLPALVYYLGYYPLIIRTIPADRRAALFSAQSILTLIVTSIGVFFFGQWLNAQDFPSNYQWMILVAAGLSLWSLFWWMKVRIPLAEQPDETQTQKATLLGQFRIFDSLNYRTNLGRVIFNQILGAIGLWAAPPLYILYIIKELGADEGWIGFQATIASLLALAGWTAARWLVHRWGEASTLKITSPLITFYPLLVGLSANLPLVLLATAFNSLVSPIYSLSHNNCLLRAFPKGHEHDGIAIYNTLVSIAGFLMPLAGVGLAEAIGLKNALILSGMVSLVGSISFFLRPVKDEPENRS